MCLASYRKSTNTAQRDILPDTSYHISGNTTWHQKNMQNTRKLQPRRTQKCWIFHVLETKKTAY